MYRIRNILVTTDFSELSAVALEHANAVALLTGAKIHFLHVLEEASRLSMPRVDKNSETSLRNRETQAHIEMKKFLVRSEIEAGAIVQVVIRGNPLREILRYTRVADIDLIIIATHGRTGFAHILMGSVAEKVVRLSPVPVLTVKPKAFIDDLMTRADVETNLHMQNS